MKNSMIIYAILSAVSTLHTGWYTGTPRRFSPVTRQEVAVARQPFGQSCGAVMLCYL